MFSIININIFYVRLDRSVLSEWSVKLTSDCRLNTTSTAYPNNIEFILRPFDLPVFVIYLQHYKGC